MVSWALLASASVGETHALFEPIHGSYPQAKGKGIAKADLKNIFERFYRADSSRTKNESGGYGLGLSIAKNIIQTNGGSIAVDSVEGFGSVFTVTLKKAE